MDAYQSLGASLHSILKPEGFKKQRLTWNKRETDRVSVLQVQKSSWAEPHEAIFTLNLGVCFLDVHRLCWGSAPPKFVNDVRCCPKFRIGTVIDPSPKEAYDIWWETDRKNGFEATINDVRSKVVDYGLPFFRATEDLGAAIEMSIRNLPMIALERVNLGIMQHLNGDYEEGRRTLTDLAASSSFWRSFVEGVLGRIEEREVNS